MVLRFRLALWLSLSIFLVSCSKSDIDVVIEKLPASELAVQRWDALLERDFVLAYAYETPAFRSTYTADLYVYNNVSTVDWKEIKLLDSKMISDDLVEVQLELTYLYDEGGDFEQLLDSILIERWIRIDDQWWHVPSN